VLGLVYGDAFLESRVLEHLFAWTRLVTLAVLARIELIVGAAARLMRLIQNHLRYRLFLPLLHRPVFAGEAAALLVAVLGHKGTDVFRSADLVHHVAVFLVVRLL